MTEFRFLHPMEVRYGDVDWQGHVNNAKYFTYMETARIHYWRMMGFWGGGEFMALGPILADAQVSFKQPMQIFQKINVGVRISRLGNKSFTMDHMIQDSETGVIHATGRAILVAYNYKIEQSIPVPAEWRKKIAAYEGISEG